MTPQEAARLNREAVDRITKKLDDGLSDIAYGYKHGYPFDSQRVTELYKLVNALRSAFSLPEFDLTVPARYGGN